MKLHWSVVLVLSVCIAASGLLVWQDKVGAGLFAAAVSGIIGWLLPSPLIPKETDNAPKG